MSELIYIGDPMCSWCWGMAPELQKLRSYCTEKGINFKIMVGGLRPTAQPMDAAMQQYLRHHWQQVNKTTGQPFNYNLLDRDDFKYHTEPACRLVVASRKWLFNQELDWFEAIQSLFYTESKDLTEPENIRELCAEFDLDFNLFQPHFKSEQVIQQTRGEFSQTRAWGINAYPTLVYQHQGDLTGIARGYRTFNRVKSVLHQVLSKSPLF